MIVLKVGMSDRIVLERVFEKRDSRVVKNEVSEFVGGERGVGR